ncbi:MAG: ABC transporter permease [Succinivibrio sp.]
MFLRMLKGSLLRLRGKMMMVALTVALGSSLATAMLNVMLDVGDKVNSELKTYGANIRLLPVQASLLNDLYEGAGDSNQYISEKSLSKIKTIFWAYNIVDFAPFLNVTAKLDSKDVKVSGTYFNKTVSLPTGESFKTGLKGLKNWWNIEGKLPDDNDSSLVCVGKNLSLELDLKKGQKVSMTGEGGKMNFSISCIIEGGGAEDDSFLMSLDAAQKLSGRDDAVSLVEVSALTTPDNELSKRAAINPNALSIKEMETWYCTAYVSSICYQLEEAITGVVAKPVRQVASSEGAILSKIELLMTLITALSLLGSALGISNLVTASVMERSKEIGLLKALGSTNTSVAGLILSSVMVTAFVGGVFGYLAGILFAKLIGQSVFGSAIEIKTLVIPLVTLLIILVSLLGSIPAIRLLTTLKPSKILHGGH